MGWGFAVSVSMVLEGRFAGILLPPFFPFYGLLFLCVVFSVKVYPTLSLVFFVLVLRYRATDLFFSLACCYGFWGWDGWVDGRMGGRICGVGGTSGMDDLSVDDGWMPTNHPFTGDTCHAMGCRCTVGVTGNRLSYGSGTCLGLFEVMSWFAGVKEQHDGILAVCFPFPSSPPPFL